MLDIIWNISLICPWNCEFCCTDAVYVRKKYGEVIATEKSLSVSTAVNPDLEGVFNARYPGVSPTIFDLALIDRQQRGLELSYEDKLNVLKNLQSEKVKIDFAGGDPLACFENYLVIRQAAERFGRECISVTATGFVLKHYGVETVAEVIGEYEFTYDEPVASAPCTRPNGYNSLNLKQAEKFARLGVKTKAQLPLHPGNLLPHKAEAIYRDLEAKNIDELLLMRTFPVGRGMAYLDANTIDKAALQATIEQFKRLEQSGSTKVRLQCALRHLFEPSLSSNPCDMMRESFGVNSTGELLLSAWANNAHGLPLSDDFVLGKISRQSFSNIAQTQKFQTLLARMDENFGHCEIFSFVSGGRNLEALFAKTDPLYTEHCS